MRKNFISLLFLCYFFISFPLLLKSQDYSFDWIQIAEGVNKDYVNGMQYDRDGNIYIYGNFQDSLSLGSQTINSRGDFDFFLAKYKPDGQSEWVKSFGGKGFDNLTSFDIDEAGNIYITGNFMNTIVFGVDTLTAIPFSNNFLIKLSPEGNVLFVNGIRNSNKISEIFVKTLSDNSILIAGSFYDNVNYKGITLSSEGSSDVFIFKLDNTGNLLNYLQIGGAGKIRLNDIIVDSSDNLLLAGFFTDSVTFDNNVYKSAGKKDAFVLKYNSDLEFMNCNHLQCIFNAEVSKISSNMNGIVSVSGTFRGEIKLSKKNYLTSNGADDIFILDYTDKGRLLNYRSLGGEMNEKVYSLIYDKEGTKLISGSFKGEIEENGFKIQSQNQNNDLFIGKIGTDDELADLVKFGGTHQDYIESVTSGIDSCIYITGGFDKDFMFNSDLVITGNEKDIFLIKLNKCTNKNASNKSIPAKKEDTVQTADIFLSDTENSKNTDASKTILNSEENQLFDFNNELSIYVSPNPSDGRFILYVNNADTNDALIYKVYTLSGKLIQTKQITGNISKINLKDKSNGVYILKVISKSTVLNKVIIISE